jgi:hypothetical protein
MTELYWDAGETPDALLYWVNENVIAAIKDCWEVNKPVGWVKVENGRIILKIVTL